MCVSSLRDLGGYETLDCICVPRLLGDVDEESVVRSRPTLVVFPKGRGRKRRKLKRIEGSGDLLFQRLNGRRMHQRGELRKSGERFLPFAPPRDEHSDPTRRSPRGLRENLDRAREVIEVITNRTERLCKDFMLTERFEQ